MPITGFDDDANTKIQRCKELFSSVYYESSVIGQLVQIRDARETDLDFLKIYRRTYIPKEWFIRTDHYPDLVFRQFGANLAFSEKKHILDRVLENEEIERISHNVIEYADLRSALLRIVERTTQTPLVMFLPINYYTRFHIDWVRNNNRELRISYPQGATILGHNITVYWSNKYMPLNSFILLDKGFGQWISKPNFNNRLQVTITDSDKADQLDFLAFTTFKFDITNTNRAIILDDTSNP